MGFVGRTTSPVHPPYKSLGVICSPYIFELSSVFVKTQTQNTPNPKHPKPTTQTKPKRTQPHGGLNAAGGLKTSHKSLITPNTGPNKSCVMAEDFFFVLGIFLIFVVGYWEVWFFF